MQKRLLLFLIVFAKSAFAGTTGLPWETGISIFSKSLSGPVAALICSIGIAVAGIQVMFGHDFKVMGLDVSRMAVAGGIACLGPATLLALYGVSGAVV